MGLRRRGGCWTAGTRSGCCRTTLFGPGFTTSCVGFRTCGSVLYDQCCIACASDSVYSCSEVSPVLCESESSLLLFRVSGGCLRPGVDEFCAVQAPRDSPMTVFLGRPRERGVPYVRCPPSPPNALGLTLKVRCPVLLVSEAGSSCTRRVDVAASYHLSWHQSI